MSRTWRTAIADAFRVLAKPILVLLAGTLASPSHATPPPADQTPRAPTLRAFFDELGRDRVLRARFARSPRDVLAERGLELPGFALPDRFSDTEIDRLLERWPALADPTPPPAGPPARDRAGTDDVIAMQPSPVVPSVVYGPPAGPPRRDGAARPPPRAPNGTRAAPQRPGAGPPPAGTPPSDRD